MQMGAEFSGGLAEDAFEHAVELGERLKPDVVRDFADAAAWIQKLGLGVFQADPGDVIGKLKPGRFLKDLAKMEDAGAGGLRDG